MRKIVFAFIAIMAAVPIAANAAAITYDFTGTVTSATGIYSSAAATVTGSFTIDLANADPSVSNSPTTSGLWQETSYGGSDYGRPLPSALVDWSVIDSGGIAYSTPPVGPADVASVVLGYTTSTNGPSPPANGYAVIADQELATGVITESSFTLIGGTGSSFNSDGLPVFSNSISAVGELWSGVNGEPVTDELLFDINSMTLAPVPLPSTAWLMLCGLGGLGVLLKKRRAV
jgi:hypothetical protein